MDLAVELNQSTAGVPQLQMTSALHRTVLMSCNVCYKSRRTMPKRKTMSSVSLSQLFCLLIAKSQKSSFLIRVITKLPNSEQSYKGKVKTHTGKYINRQNQSTTGKL